MVIDRSIFSSLVCSWVTKAINVNLSGVGLKNHKRTISMSMSTNMATIHDLETEENKEWTTFMPGIWELLSSFMWLSYSIEKFSHSWIQMNGIKDLPLVWNNELWVCHEIMIIIYAVTVFVLGCHYYCSLGDPQYYFYEKKHSCQTVKTYEKCVCIIKLLKLGKLCNCYTSLIFSFHVDDKVNLKAGNFDTCNSIMASFVQKSLLIFFVRLFV